MKIPRRQQTKIQNGKRNDIATRRKRNTNTQNLTNNQKYEIDNI